MAKSYTSAMTIALGLWGNDNFKRFTRIKDALTTLYSPRKKGPQ
jgi:hypothetical protein